VGHDRFVDVLVLNFFQLHLTWCWNADAKLRKADTILILTITIVVNIYSKNHSFLFMLTCVTHHKVFLSQLCMYSTYKISDWVKTFFPLRLKRLTFTDKFFFSFFSKALVIGQTWMNQMRKGYKYRVNKHDHIMRLTLHLCYQSITS